MTGEQRRKQILEILQQNTEPVSGTFLAKELQVSRQVIVQDMALLRAADVEILTTHKGYLLGNKRNCSRVFKVVHEDGDTERELNIFVDYGGCVEDVFVYHKVYGIVRANMGIHNRREVKRYMEDLKSGHSSLLKNVTDGYHYHTITAESEEILDDIQNELDRVGFLAPLREYEPVDFWKNQ